MLRQHVRLRRKSRVRRRRRLQVVAVGLAGVGGAWAMLAGMGMVSAHWFRSTVAWRIQAIELLGARTESSEALAAALPIRVGDSLWGFSKARVERGLLQRFPAVARVVIQRRWPARVVLRVYEREPVGWMWQRGDRWAVDAEGAVFPIRTPERLTPCPEFAGTESLEDRRLLVRFLQRWQALGGERLPQQIVRCAADRFPNELSFWLEDGTHVFWGSLQEDRIAEMRPRLSVVLADAHRRFPAIDYVDLRYQQRGIIIKPLRGGQRGST